MKAIDRILEFLEGIDQTRRDTYGGYPHQVDGIPSRRPKFIVEATIDYKGAPELNIWTIREIVRWHRRACAYLKANPEEDWCNAFFATW